MKQANAILAAVFFFFVVLCTCGSISTENGLMFGIQDCINILSTIEQILFVWLWDNLLILSIYPDLHILIHSFADTAQYREFSLSKNCDLSMLGEGKGRYTMSKCQNMMPKMSKTKLKCQKRSYAKMFRILNILRLGHLPEAENNLQIQNETSTATRHIGM